LSYFLMTIRTRKALVATLFAAAALVAGCGGDSAPAPAPAPPPPPSTGPSPTCTTPGETYSVVADTATNGRTVGAVVAGCSGPLRDVSWQQVPTGAPTVTLQSAKTQAISFDPPSAGTYTFSVSFTDAVGTPRTASATIVATAPTTAASFVARSDQAVRAGGKASVRAWPAAAAGETLTWRQTAGPAVGLDTSDPNRILFTAPNVTQDTALVFRVTRTNAGVTDFDDVTVLVEAYTQAPPDPNETGPYIFSDMHVSRVYPYKATSPYAGVLVGCTFSAQLQYKGTGTNLCPLATLPFLHQTTGGSVPTVAQIMDRVLVSHDWQGRNFEAFLQANVDKTDLLRLFNGVTAIVIGAHVRPSFYYAATGAIYLDADNFWLTAGERDVIDEAPDFRSDFDRDLQYSGLWRYVDSNNLSIFLPFKATERVTRDVGYLSQESNWLLYHELGHASDFMPVSARATLDSAASAWINISRVASRPSDRLDTLYRLTSSEMKALAEIKFITGPVSDGTLVNGIPYSTLKTYTPAQVGGFFAPDLATDEYNYSTIREDLTMTFEEVMMSRNHNWRRDVAMTDKATPTSTSETLIVRWGQRGRIGEAAIRPRAQFVVSEIAPWLDAAAVVGALPAPIAMRPGESWKANLVVPAPPGGMASAMAFNGVKLTTEEDQILLRRALSRQLIGVSGPSMAHWAPNERMLKRLRAP
jgi:hypothetical protein